MSLPNMRSKSPSFMPFLGFPLSRIYWILAWLSAFFVTRLWLRGPLRWERPSYESKPAVCPIRPWCFVAGALPCWVSSGLKPETDFASFSKVARTLGSSAVLTRNFLEFLRRS